MFVTLLLINGEPQQAEILKDDSPWDGECFRLKNNRIRLTVCRKIACPHFTLFLCSVDLKLEVVVGQVIGFGEGIGDIVRGWGT